MSLQSQDEATVLASEDNTQERAAKKRKGTASDRITLDVGGTKFVTSVLTLTTNSTFASLLSGNWSHSQKEGGEIFLDQDPVAFRELLAYMRRGTIKIDKVDTDVLTLAEFLGVETLLLAVKVRWYCNIGKGPALYEDGEIAAAFDREYGMAKAISAGLFPCFHNNRTGVYAEMDFAVIVATSTDGNNIGITEDSIVKVFELTQGKKGRLDPAVSCDGMIGALNGLYANGYKFHEDQIDHDWPLEESLVFSRKRHSAIRCISTDIFIPNDGVEIEETNYFKQFAAYVKNVEGWMTGGTPCEKIIAPAELSNDPNPYAQVTITDEEDGIEFWLERNNFVTREDGIEEHSLIKLYLQGLRVENHDTCGMLYSRQTPRVR